MAAANTRRIINLRQFNPSPENELHVDYSAAAPGEATGGREGRKRFSTAAVLGDLIQDFQNLAQKYDDLEAEVAQLRAGAGGTDINPLTLPPKPASPTDGAVLKQPGDGLAEYYAGLDAGRGINTNPFDPANNVVHDEHGPALPRG